MPASPDVKQQPTRGRLREYSAPSVQQAPRRVEVDESGENGVIYDVLIVGNESRGMGVYPPEVQAAALAKYDGAPTYVNHTKDGSNPDYLKKLGVHRSPRMSPEGTRTNFHFNAKHPAASQLIWDAKNAPNTLGFSHDADCTWHWGDNRKRVVDSIDKVYAVDLVSKAGTVNGLFEDEQEAIAGDPTLAGIADGTLSAMDNMRSILFAPDQTPEQRRERLIEAAVQLHAELLEGEIADEIRADEKRRQLRRINETASDLVNRAMWNDEAWPTIGHKKARCLEVLADWEKEINALSSAGGAQLQEEETTMGVELKDLTAEQLTKDRPDLVSIIKGTDEHSKMQEELKTLKAASEAKDEELKTLRAERAARLREQEVAAELKAANFPVSDEKAFSSTFKEQLLAAPTKEARSAMISDRLALIGSRMQEQAGTPSPLADLNPASPRTDPGTEKKFFG